MAVASLLFFSAMMAVERPPEVLPLRKLRLYETGVGYFERRGSVGASNKLALPVPAAHLDDALKSLVVLQGNGTVQGIEFTSTVSEEMARTMAGLPADAGAAVSYADLLQSLQGSSVEVRTAKAKIRGRLMQVEGPFTVRRSETAAKPVPADKSAPEEPYYTLLVLDDDDAIRRISTSDVQAVRAVGKGTAARLGVAAESVSTQRAHREQQLEVQVSSRGQLGIGYIAESPVWRTTYRVVLGEEQSQGQLQAWALVHNDTDEDWEKVWIELASGRPRSFTHSLAMPRYAYRDALAVDDGLSTVPQSGAWGSLSAGSIGEAYGVGGLGLSGTGRGGGGTGEGTVGLGSMGVVGGNQVGDLAKLSKASTLESGALFIYRAENAINLDAHHSALVPLVQEDVEVESVTIFASASSEAASGVRLVNTTGRTLPAGVVSFFADGGFVGEAVFDRLRAKERRFIEYGAELDVRLTQTQTQLAETTTGVRFVNDQVVEDYLESQSFHLGVDNRSTRAQKIYVALPVPRRAELKAEAGVELDFDLAQNRPLAAFDVAALKVAKHTLTATIPAVRAHAPDDVKALEALAAKPGVPAKSQKTLLAAHKLLLAAEADDRAAAKISGELSTALIDLQRQRQNLKAVGEADARTRLKDKLTRELLALEKRVKELRVKIEGHTSAATAGRGRATAELKQL